MITLNVNGIQHSLDVDPNKPLLWVLREELKMTGTKYACGLAQCGSCTVHVNGVAEMSCVLAIASVAGKNITTIEGLATDEQGLHAVQQAWLDENVPECGYCQSGQIMTAVALLEKNPDPSDEAIKKEMSKVLCRCGTYQRIHKAIKRAVQHKVNRLVKGV